MKIRLYELSSGLLLCLAVALPAWYLGRLYPLIGGPVFGILGGMALAFWNRPASANPGIRFTSKKILQLSIILLGFDMNLLQVVKTGGQSLAVMVFTLSAAFITAWAVGKALKLHEHTTILIGVGTAICGGSAIAATAPVIQAKDQDVAYAISTIFLFNIAAVFLFPFTGHLLHLSDTGFGMWAGTAINDTSSVVAAAYSYSVPAGNMATVVKLTRTLMIIPITLVLALMTSRGKTVGSSRPNLMKIFPWFVAGFLLASLVRTYGIIPATGCTLLGQAGRFCIILAMAAIGLNTHLRELVRNGMKPIALGMACWAAVALTSLLVQKTLGIW